MARPATAVAPHDAAAARIATGPAVRANRTRSFVPASTAVRTRAIAPDTCGHGRTGRPGTRASASLGRAATRGAAPGVVPCARATTRRRGRSRGTGEPVTWDRSPLPHAEWDAPAAAGTPDRRTGAGLASCPGSAPPSAAPATRSERACARTNTDSGGGSYAAISSASVGVPGARRSPATVRAGTCGHAAIASEGGTVGRGPGWSDGCSGWDRMGQARCKGHACRQAQRNRPDRGVLAAFGRCVPVRRHCAGLRRWVVDYRVVRPVSCPLHDRAAAPPLQSAAR